MKSLPLITLLFLAGAFSFPTRRFGVSTVESSMQPITVSTYEVWTGAVHFDVKRGQIIKNGRAGDITTLLMFRIDPTSANKTCGFHFRLRAANATRTGPESFDVFSSLAPATQSTAGWGPGSQRDQHLGRMQVDGDGRAGFVATNSPNAAENFPCGKYAKSGLLPLELVGAGDNVRIEWDREDTVAGPTISIS